MRRLVPFWVATLLSLGGVSCASSVGPPLAVHVDWGLDGPAGTIPITVTQLTVLVYTGAATDPQSSIHTVANLDDADGDAHPDLVRGDLPTGVPIRMTIQGQGAGGATLYLGHVGPFVLEAGERRYLDLQMFSVGGYTSPPGTTVTPRMLATASTLSDGRVLIAGGFSHAAAMACPAIAPTGATCFDLTAANDAFIFDVASGDFLPVHGGLHQARGGHTATVLPGDRVLIAGGAAHAVLALVGSGTTYAPILLPLDTTAPAATSFEIFAPDANAEPEDLDRNGDPGRGGFVGGADDPTGLGRLDSARFLHGAAAIPGHPGQVLLVGGIDSPDSWAVYDDARAGGYGVLDSTMNHLHASRATPNVVPLHGAMGDALWIVGGDDAASNDDLAEVWTSTAAAPNGSTVLATMRMFPEGTTTSGDRPELSLLGATAIPLDATHAVFVGWYGPLCDPSSATPTAPVFSGASPTLARCDFALTTRSFTLDGMTGRTVSTSTHTRHAFGSGVRMSDGSGLVTGGFGGLALNTTNGTDHFNATVPATGSAQISDVQPVLTSARAYHATAALEDGGALIFGGVSINTMGAAPTVTLVAAPEILYLPR